MSSERQEMHVEVHHLEPADYSDLKDAMVAAYPNMDDAYHSCRSKCLGHEGRECVESI